MLKKKVLFINRPHAVLQEKLLAAGFGIQEAYEEEGEALYALLSGFEGIVMRSRVSADRAFLDAASNLKFLAREGVGTDHIDMEYAASKGIEVIISPEGSRDTVGEHALGMLLMLMNRLGEADRQVRAGKWLREENRGTEIMGKTVGVLGYGNMGTAFARKISGLGARVIAYDKYRKDYGDDFAQAVSLEELWQESDILSIHIPYIPSNHYFVDFNFLQRFHKAVFVVNTARGPVLKTEGLVRHMKTGKVRGAALDVLEYEELSFEKVPLQDPPPPLRYLLESDRAVLAPHIAGWSFESKRKHAEVLAEKIVQWYKERELL